MIGTIRWTARLLVVLLVLVLAFAIARRFVPNPLARLAEAVGIVRTEERSSASILLEEVRDIYLLHTVEYAYQTVFPYDFYPEGIGIQAILEKLRTRRGTVEQILSDREELYFEAYNIAQELGLLTGPGTYEFLVVPVRVSAGLNLDSLSGAPIDWVGIDGTHVRFDLPQASVTDVELRDLSSAEYGYPDVQLSPEQWRRVASFVSERIRQRAVEDGILTAARENARRLVESLVTEAGYESVEFASHSSEN